jgi:hypothetical protein
MGEPILYSLNKLIRHCESEEFMGFDPYDALNSFINFKLLGRWGPPAVIQLQKRNPINIRFILGIKKNYNPKGMGLFLKAYCILYKKTGTLTYLENARFLFNWLKNNFSKGYSGHAWGYNFDWASSEIYLPAFTPSVVVTSFVVDGIFEYYQLTKDEEAKTLINSASQYIINDIPVTQFENGLAFSYSHLLTDCCYNASLLAAEVLAKADYLNGTKSCDQQINKAIDFVLSKQHNNGEWWYSYNPKNGIERKQIDFHQGFIIISLANLNAFLNQPRTEVNLAIEKGLHYYRNKQFFENGQSLWRIPKKWPVDIHNQSQGILTFASLKDYNSGYLEFAKKVSEWTIKNMQSKQGFFFFRKNPLYTNRIPYMRWSQAWMMLALAVQIQYED